MNVVAYDPYPLKDADFPYVSLEELLHQSDIISLHCPLTERPGISSTPTPSPR